MHRGRKQVRGCQGLGEGLGVSTHLRGTELLFRVVEILELIAGMVAQHCECS